MNQLTEKDLKFKNAEKDYQSITDAKEKEEEE